MSLGDRRATLFGMADPVSELTWYDLPDLRRPLLLVAFEGLFDAAEAASGALDWIRDRSDATSVGMIDPERFYNFQEARPMVRLDGDGSRVIDWPSAEIWHQLPAHLPSRATTPSSA